MHFRKYHRQRRNSLRRALGFKKSKVNRQKSEQDVEYPFNRVLHAFVYISLESDLSIVLVDDIPTAPPTPRPEHVQGMLHRHDTLLYLQEPIEVVTTSQMQEQLSPEAPPTPPPVYRQGMLRRHDTVLYQKGSMKRLDSSQEQEHYTGSYDVCSSFRNLSLEQDFAEELGNALLLLHEREEGCEQRHLQNVVYLDSENIQQSLSRDR
ncbi:hypothetical protein EV361DRAFT_870936 [Lentinula raphanica]|nr:hypothetical protein EV361DRAFT_870936 [Lentinula raphanica]